MDDPQIIKTPSGEELVVLPRGDYDALLGALADAKEELADIAVLDKRLAEMAALSVPNLPEPVSALLLEGHRLLAALRIWRGLTPAELAQRASITEDVVAGYESGSNFPDATSVPGLAKALDVPEAWIAP